MRFTLYTQKTITQCLSALNERMQAKETSTRPAIDGWMDKSGKFAISVRSKVAVRFERKTRLQAELKRESGVTIIEGFVPSGVDNRGQFVILGALVAMGLLLAVQGNFMFGVIIVLLGVALYFMLLGDQRNSETLMKEVRKTLDAKTRPPKK